MIRTACSSLEYDLHQEHDPKITSEVLTSPLTWSLRLRILNSQIFITECCVLCFHCDISLFTKPRNLAKVGVGSGIFNGWKLLKLCEMHLLCRFCKCSRYEWSAYYQVLMVLDTQVFVSAGRHKCWRHLCIAVGWRKWSEYEKCHTPCDVSSDKNVYVIIVISKAWLVLELRQPSNVLPVLEPSWYAFNLKSLSSSGSVCVMW